MDGIMYYSVEKIENDVVYLDADGLQVCASIDKFDADVQPTDMVVWQDGRFVTDTAKTDAVKQELYDRVHNISK